jgi:hypothetical protein
MPVETVSGHATLFEADETAWLETMAELIERGEFQELDYAHLAEYLAGMARRDRREVFSRLVVLLTHLLKWQYQPERRTNRWQASIIAQRQDLEGLVDQGVLRDHAQSVIADAYTDAAEIAATEIGLMPEQLPAKCRYSLDELLEADLFLE